MNRQPHVLDLNKSPYHTNCYRIVLSKAMSEKLITFLEMGKLMNEAKVRARRWHDASASLYQLGKTI